MNLVFADTFYWIALTLARDANHRRAIQISRELRQAQICTGEPILIEYLNYFAEAGRDHRSRAFGNVRDMLDDRSIRVLPCTAGSLQSGLRLYEARPDKGYSLTDCISMEMMRDEGIRHVLTNDSHFQQEGFVALFR